MTAPKPDPIPAVLDAYGIRDENVTDGEVERIARRVPFDMPTVRAVCDALRPFGLEPEPFMNMCLAFGVSPASILSILKIPRNPQLGPPPNLLTPDEIRRIRAALDRMEALPEDLVEAPEFDTFDTTPSGKDFHLAYIIGVASLAILAGLWLALR